MRSTNSKYRLAGGKGTPGSSQRNAAVARVAAKSEATGKAAPVTKPAALQEKASACASGIEAVGTGVVFITIDEDAAGQRIDNFLLRILKGVPKTRVYRIVRKGEVRVNKKRVTADYRLALHDQVRVPPVTVAQRDAPVRPSDKVIHQLEQAVLYEDDQLLIINKPSGLAVHGGSGLSYGVIEALRQLRPQNRTLELVHRLDRDTSGCLVIAKRRSMLRHLHNQLQQKGRVEKLYHALVFGKWPARKQLVNAPLLKNVLQSGERMVRVHVDGKQSRTAYRVLERFGGMTLVEAYPITGRTHQIRVHCLHAGHPIAGDEKYAMDEDNQEQKQFGLNRLFLHAASIQFALPDGRLLKVAAPLPAELAAVLTALKEQKA